MMMKNIVILSASCLAFAAMAEAQGPGDFRKLTVEEVAAPTSPAFVLLGVAPSTIQRPTTPRAIATSFVSLARETSTIPKNYALEVAPFWLRSQPGFLFEDQYAGSRPMGTVIASTFRSTSSFSMGTSAKLKGKDTVGTAFGLGYSVLFWPGSASPRLMKLKDTLETALGMCAMATDVTKCYNGLKPLMDSLHAHSDPVGFKLQFAGGGTAQFPYDTIQHGRTKSGGVWLTPSYTMESRVDFIGVVRYLVSRSDTAGIGSTKTLDVGGRLLWRPSDRFGVSAEGLNRRASGGVSVSSQRYGAVLEVKASDDMYLVYAFGQDFAAGKVKANPLFASLGLHFGFGNKPVVSW